MIKLLCF